MRVSKTSVLVGIGLVMAAGALDAQERTKEKRIEIHRVHMQGSGDHLMAMAPQAATYGYIGAGPGLEGRVVKNAPFSAEGVTETTKTLADGTKIVRRSNSKTYRDSEGRTRREHTLGTIGHWAASGEAPTTIVINDPVAGEVFVLNPEDKTAKKISVTVHIHGEHGEPAPEPFDVRLPAGAAGPHGAVWIERRELHDAHGERVEEHDFTAVAGHRTAIALGENAKKEDLGERNVEGVVAKGTRTTVTIPEGQIGNDRELRIVTEQWYSPELQTVVLRVSKDPLSGDVTYKLTNIQRGNPPASVFQVPPDYTVEAGSTIHRNIRIEEHKK